MNIDQLNALSDYEINCAVAEKLGYRVEREIQANIGFTESFREQYPHTIWGWKDNKSPCEQLCFTRTPDEYMPIAIKHAINISHSIDRERKNIIAEHYPGFDFSKGSRKQKRAKTVLPKAQTGRAVCITFLLMNGESND